MSTLSKKEYKNLVKLVYEFKTKHKEGFLPMEQEALLKQFPNINMNKYYDALQCVTCEMDSEGNFVTYHCDILKALICGLENRDLTLEEWD